jgi:hypothetical protein
MEIGRSWVYYSEDFPDSLNSCVTDTSTIKNRLYYYFAPYGPDSHIATRYWLRPEPYKIFALNLDDSTEYLLFDFEAEIDDSWNIPPVLKHFGAPVNQCDWGSSIKLASKSDTIYNFNDSLFNVFRFSHEAHPCYDAGIYITKFVRDVGIMQLSQVTEGGVIDWNVYIEPPDTSILIGIYTMVGNPCYTVPCLPGVVSAVSANNTNYIITTNNHFHNEFSWGDYSPNIGDSVKLKGVISDRMDVNNGHYYAVEIFEFAAHSTTSIASDYNNNVAQQDILIGNYPNPFNAITTISFQLTASDFVQLTVYDIDGKQVAILYSGQMNLGKHSIRWDAKQIASGVYIYRLQGSQFNAAKKLILFK